MNKLMELLGLSPRIDSQGQLDAAKRETYSDALEVEARRRGFPSAEAYVNWQRQQNVDSRREGSRIPSVSSITQHPMHPKNMLDYILNAMRGN